MPRCPSYVEVVLKTRQTLRCLGVPHKLREIFHLCSQSGSKREDELWLQALGQVLHGCGHTPPFASNRTSAAHRPRTPPPPQLSKELVVCRAGVVANPTTAFQLILLHTHRNGLLQYRMKAAYCSSACTSNRGNDRSGLESCFAR